jgi:hypothetical protein
MSVQQATYRIGLYQMRCIPGVQTADTRKIRDTSDTPARQSIPLPAAFEQLPLPTRQVGLPQLNVPLMIAFHGALQLPGLVYKALKPVDKPSSLFPVDTQIEHRVYQPKQGRERFTLDQ